jgi:4'-phosphopantetheinyl transferase
MAVAHRAAALTPAGAQWGSVVYVSIFPANAPERDCADLAAILSPDERERAARYRFEADRVRSIVSRAAARRLLGRFAHVDPRAIRFVTTEHGKPLVDAPAEAAGLFFNLSHSGEFAAIAISRTAPVGIDIEHHRSFNTAELAERYFSLSEREWLARLSPAEALRGFYRLWTVKEAVLKAHGHGLSVPLDAVTAEFKPEGVTLRLGASLFGRWEVQELEAPPGYCAAVATEGDRLQLTAAEI